MMKTFAAIFVLLLGFPPVHLSADDGVLGNFPICEASAVVSWNCGESDERCLLVGDNEIRTQLFSFETSRLKSRDYRSWFLADEELSDIEALADLGSGRFLVVASHGRNKNCKPTKKRRRFIIGTMGPSGFEVTSLVKMKDTLKDTLLDSKLFKKNLSSKRLKAVRDRILDVEKAADLEEGKDKDTCLLAQPFNIEGTVGVSKRAWVGLRAPLLDKDPESSKKNLAILLRMTDLKSLHFDAVALLDLKGMGIRDLSSHKGSILVIAGPTDDSTEGFRLYQFSIQSLAPDALIKPTKRKKLMSSAEGITVIDSTAYVVVDGEIDKKECEKESRYLTFELKE